MGGEGVRAGAPSSGREMGVLAALSTAMVRSIRLLSIHPCGKGRPALDASAPRFTGLREDGGTKAALPRRKPLW